MLESGIQYVCTCVLMLRASGTSCALTASPTVGRVSSIGPEQCQKKAVIKTNYHALVNTGGKRRVGAYFPLHSPLLPTASASLFTRTQ